MLSHTHTQVEHYHKKQSFYMDEECRENELRVASSGKPHDLATRAGHIIKVRSNLMH